MWRYDSEGFDPPAPVLDVVLWIGDKRHPSVRMQVDSAADLTCIPKSLLTDSGKVRHGAIQVSGYDGEIEIKRTCFVSLRFGEYRFDDVEALPIAGEIGLIGRDVLNALEVTLDGPASTLFIERR